MSTCVRPHVTGLMLLALITSLTPEPASAQGRGRGNREQGNPAVAVEISISVTDQDEIRRYYESNPRGGVEALPPGIRRNLERGKPLPPGIAKRFPPPDLQSRLTVQEEFEFVEVGLDVFLVEVATGIIHDVLMDVIR